MGHCSVVGIWWKSERTAVEMTFYDSSVVDRRLVCCIYSVVGEVVNLLAFPQRLPYVGISMCFSARATKQLALLTSSSG
jgi:hypothetical protein